MGLRNVRLHVRVLWVQPRTAANHDQSQPAPVRLRPAEVGINQSCSKHLSIQRERDNNIYINICLPLQATRRTPSFSGCPGPAQTSRLQRSPPVKNTDFFPSALSESDRPVSAAASFLFLPDVLILQMCLLSLFLLYILLPHSSSIQSPGCNSGVYFLVFVVWDEDWWFQFTNFLGSTRFCWLAEWQDRRMKEKLCCCLLKNWLFSVVCFGIFLLS